MTWRFDISEAPRGEVVETTFERGGKTVTRVEHKPTRVIIATKCGKVMKSRWLPDVERWEGMMKGDVPVAWHPWPEYPEVSA